VDDAGEGRAVVARAAVQRGTGYCTAEPQIVGHPGNTGREAAVRVGRKVERTSRKSR
jgi:hypothetical protein